MSDPSTERALTPLDAGIVMLRRIRAAGEMGHSEAVRGLGYGHANNLRLWALKNELISDSPDGRCRYQLLPEGERYIANAEISPAAEAMAAEFEIERLTNE